MSWINERPRLWGALVLGLLLLAGSGPWGYEKVNVPAQYPCSPPSIRLEGDFCGFPYLGLRILAILPLEFIFLVAALVKGEIAVADVGRSFLVLLQLTFVLLPFISALLWIFSERFRHRWILHIAAWGLAAVFIAMMLPYMLDLPPDRLWGVWLYTGLVFGALILAIAAFANRSRSRQV